MKVFTVLLSLILLSLNGAGQSSVLIDEGFKNLPLGANTSTAWISMLASSAGISSPYCGNNTAFDFTNSASVVAGTPIQDSRCFNVSQAPFGGNKVIVHNQAAPNYGSNTRTELTQNFLVTNTTFIYRYAYNSVFNAVGQG